MDMARIGATHEGGSNRQALSAEDAEARALLLSWCGQLGLRFEQDAIGNMFLCRHGSDASHGAVAFGSHLDTVPTGGRFDGVFGVLAGLEIMRAMEEAGHRTRFPLELVNWTNEEGSRFRPAMMGSRVHAGAMSLETALAVVDDRGTTVAEALRSRGQAGPLTPSPRGWSFWLEAHIEQGPVLEAEDVDIGIVSGTMQARYLQLTCMGEPSHVGPTMMDRRRDSLATAAEIVLAVERIGRAAEPHGRASASWIENFPNALGAVAAVTRLHCDVRHEQAEQAVAMEQELTAAIAEISSRRGVAVSLDPYATFGPAVFDARLQKLLRDKATARQLSCRDIIAAAGHDSVLIAPLCPSAMLFVPSRGGITHNPREYTPPEHLAQGAQVLLDVVLQLAEGV
jgi:N-carbamoyl-L-amino-acid hydrolase